LGTEIPVRKFLEVVKKEGVRILAISTMVSASAIHLRKLVPQLKKEGLRGRLVIITGGPGLNEFYARKLGADLYDEKAESGAKRVAEFLKKSA
jgi:methanogenic corrinoid protein MtbC1